MEKVSSPKMYPHSIFNIFLSLLLSLTLSNHHHKHQTRQSNAETLNYCQPICAICCTSVCWWKGWWGTWWPRCQNNICKGRQGTAKGLHKQSCGAGKRLGLAETPKQAKLMLFCLVSFRIPTKIFEMAFSEMGMKRNFAAYRIQKWCSGIAATGNHREKEGETERNEEGSCGVRFAHCLPEGRGRMGEWGAAVRRVPAPMFWRLGVGISGKAIKNVFPSFPLVLIWSNMASPINIFFPHKPLTE